jgi:hypothetical protein
MPEWLMATKLAVQVNLLISIFSLLLIAGAWTMLSSESDEFVSVAYAMAVAFLFYVVICDTRELTKHP